MANSGNDYCFACGEKNPIGLHLTFKFDGDKIFTKKIMPKEYQGFEGALHGGIISTLLDEAMGNYLSTKYHEKAVTGRIEVRFKYPTPLEQELKITAWEENRRKNIISMHSTIETPDGTITAEATAKFAFVGAL